MISYSSMLPHRFKPQQKKYRASVEEQTHLKQSGTGYLQTHHSGCPVMAGDMDPFAGECGCDKEAFVNTALLTGIHSIIERLVNPANTTDGYVTHFEVGMSETAPANSQTGTILPKARKFVKQAYRDTTNAVFKTFWNGIEATTNRGTVAIGTSTTQFTLLATQGVLFAIGQSIRVTIGGTPYDSIISPNFKIS